MKISVVIPTQNSEYYLCQSLDSISMQCYKNYEVLICDNQSKDKTLDIVEKYKKKINIKTVSYKDSSVPEALNYGFKNSSGDILCWLNSDDIYNYNYVFRNVVKKFSENINKDYLISNFFNIDENKKKFIPFYSYIPNKKIKNLFYYNQIFTGSLFFTKRSWDNFFEFETKYKIGFEYDLIAFLLIRYEGLYVNDFYASFRIHQTNLSKNKKKLNDDLNNILKKYNLKFSNNIILKMLAHYKNKNLFKVLKKRLI